MIKDKLSTKKTGDEFSSPSHLRTAIKAAICTTNAKIGDTNFQITGTLLTTLLVGIACIAWLRFEKRLADEALFLYRQHTDTPVFCVLSPDVVSQLNAVENSNNSYLFYDGVSQKEVMVTSWNRVFKEVGTTAQPPGYQLRSASVP